MVGGIVHRPPYVEVKQLAQWARGWDGYIASRAALAGASFRTAGPADACDLIFGVFCELALSENGKKRMEVIQEIMTSLRSEPKQNLPGKAVNE